MKLRKLRARESARCWRRGGARMDRLRTRRVYGSGGGSEDRMEDSAGVVGSCRVWDVAGEGL